MKDQVEDNCEKLNAILTSQKPSRATPLRCSPFRRMVNADRCSGDPRRPWRPPRQAAKVRVRWKRLKKKKNRENTNASAHTRPRWRRRGRSAIYVCIRCRETGYTQGETRERAEQEWKPQKKNGDNCAWGNARGSSPYSGLKPATASAKLLTLRCAHMTRSAARDAHPDALRLCAYSWICLLYVYICIYTYTNVRMYMWTFVLNDGQDSLPRNLIHSTTFVAILSIRFFFSLLLESTNFKSLKEIRETRNKSYALFIYFCKLPPRDWY